MGDVDGDYESGVLGWGGGLVVGCWVGIEDSPGSSNGRTDARGDKRNHNQVRDNQDWVEGRWDPGFERGNAEWVPPKHDKAMKKKCPV